MLLHMRASSCWRGAVFAQKMLGFLGMTLVSSPGCPDEVNKKDIQTKKAESAATSTLQTSGMLVVSPTRGPWAGQSPYQRHPGMAEENDVIWDWCPAYVGFPGLHILFYILFHYGLSQGIEYSSLCYAVGPCCFSILLLLLSRLSRVRLCVTP